MSNSADPSDVESIEAIVAAAYDVISGPAGKKRDWKRERSLFISGARLIPTAVDAGRNDVDLAPQVLDVDAYIARVKPYFATAGFYERKSRGESNNSAKSRMSGARMNRVTIRTMQSHSCAGSIAFSFSMTEAAGGFYQFTGSTKVGSTRFRKSTFKVEACGSADPSSPFAPAAADACRDNTLSQHLKEARR